MGCRAGEAEDLGSLLVLESILKNWYIINMSFKKFGGLNYSAKSNIISNHYANSGNLGITDTLGQPNSKIISQSHIDMSANSIMNIGSLYFMDGTMQTTALETDPTGKAIFKHGILVYNGTTTDTLHVTGKSQLDGAVSMGNNLEVAGTTKLDSTLEVAGTSQLDGAVTVGTNAASANLEVTGTTKIDSNGNVTSGSTSGSNAALNLSGGGAFINNDLMVYGGYIYGPSTGTLNLSATSVTAPTPLPGDNSTKIATTAFVHDSVTSGSNPIGSIIMFAGTSPPANYLWCGGQTLSTTTYSSLYSIIGTTYGGSGGNFILPNLQSRFPLGSDTMGSISTNYNGGNTISSGNKNMSGNQLASHSHAIAGSTTNGVVENPNGYYFMNDLKGNSDYNMFFGGVQGTITVPNSTSGAGNTSDYLPPFTVVNYIIRYQ